VPAFPDPSVASLVKWTAWTEPAQICAGSSASSGKAKALIMVGVKANVSRAWLITDDIIGRFSYPIYLMQLLSFGILTDHGMSSALSPAIGLKVLLGTIAIAACGLVVVDAPIQLVRKLVRGNVQTRHAPLLPTDRAVPVVIPAITAPKSLM
jgi:peptidoglycan/LPS O-acetylase OafA/YrhL